MSGPTVHTVRVHRISETLEYCTLQAFISFSFLIFSNINRQRAENSVSVLHISEGIFQA